MINILNYLMAADKFFYYLLKICTSVPLCLSFTIKQTNLKTGCVDCPQLQHVSTMWIFTFVFITTSQLVTVQILKVGQCIVVTRTMTQ